ncbi:MAG: hypothetical protein ACI8TA_002415 [Cyclobacteriaceae bacterium]|jgi:hypothetical protein
MVGMVANPSSAVCLCAPAHNLSSPKLLKSSARYLQGGASKVPKRHRVQKNKNSRELHSTETAELRAEANSR